MTYGFTNRKSYLAFRREWKTKYLNLSTDIRNIKDEIKRAQREGDYRAGHLQAERELLRRDATLMLENLAAAKLEAQMQYEEAKMAAV